MLFLMKPSSLFPLILSFSIVIRHINVSTVFPFFPLPVLSPPTSCTALGSPYPSFSLINHGVGQVSPVSTAFSPCLPTSHVSLSLALPFPPYHLLQLLPPLCLRLFHLIPILYKFIPCQAYLNPNFPTSLPFLLLPFHLNVLLLSRPYLILWGSKLCSQNLMP